MNLGRFSFSGNYSNLKVRKDNLVKENFLKVCEDYSFESFFGDRFLDRWFRIFR